MKNIHLILACGIILLMNSCAIERRLYMPTQVNNPYLQKAGDFAASTTYSAPSGTDINGGIAITDRLAIIGGYNYYKVSDKERESFLFANHVDSSLLNYKHQGFHAGIGAYFPVSEDKETIFLSFFGGLIKNKFNMREALYEVYPNPSSTPKLNFYNSDINRWFLQGSFNFYPGRFHLAFTTRFNYAVYENVVTDYTADEQESYNLPPTAYPKGSTFLDGSFDASYFFNKSRSLGLQVFSVATIRLARRDYNFYYYPQRIGIGLLLKSPVKPRKKEKE